MKTLVIHPPDPTTDFLKDIYEDKDWMIVNLELSRAELRNRIMSCDRIVMLGHGTAIGLIGYGRFVINSSWAYILQDKETVSIWCNADKYAKEYGLRGVCTGMIISEVDEAEFCNVPATQEEITASNKLFARAIKNSIDTDSFVKKAKGIYVGDSPVIKFNRENIFTLNTKAI